MKTLLVYTTRHGCTEKCASLLKDKIAGEVTIVDLKKTRPDALDNYEAVIVGGSIHVGKIQGKIKKYCKKHLETLKSKKLGLFICCMEEGDSAQKEFNQAFPPELISHASVTGIFGGEFNLDRMNTIEKKMIKKVAGVEENVSKIKEENVNRFAQEFQNK